MLIHQLHSQAQWTHTSISTSLFPSCKMPVLPSGTWHSCKKASPGQSPCAATVPSLGMARAARQQPTLLAAAHSSVVPNLCQFHTCPALQGRAGLGYLLCSNLRVLRTHSFPARAELVLSTNRTWVWDAASYSDTKRCFCEGELPWKHWESQPGAMGSWSSKCSHNHDTEGLPGTLG